MGNKRKKEPTEQVTARIKRFKKIHGYKKLQIYITDDLKYEFDVLEGLSEISNTQKLKALIDCWNVRVELNKLKKQEEELLNNQQIQDNDALEVQEKELMKYNIIPEAEETNIYQDERNQPQNIYDSIHFAYTRSKKIQDIQQSMRLRQQELEQKKKYWKQSLKEYPELYNAIKTLDKYLLSGLKDFILNGYFNIEANDILKLVTLEHGSQRIILDQALEFNNFDNVRKSLNIMIKFAELGKKPR